MNATAKLEYGHVAELAISKLVPDPDQPRKTFAEGALIHLAHSIEKSGVRVPLLVRPGLRGKWIIVDGERRYRAAKQAKLKTLPVLLDAAGSGDQDLRAAQLTVNNLREQLKPMEIARTLASLQREHFKSPNELAKWIDDQGLPATSPARIKEYITLVDLPGWIQDMLDAGQVEASGAVLVRKAEPWPEVLEGVKRQLDREVKYGGKASKANVSWALRSAFALRSVDLDRTNEWDRSSAVHFNPKTVCKGCEHLVNIDGSKYCMNREEFERKNAEAKAAGLLPGGKKPAKPVEPGKAAEKEVEQKAEKRARTLGQKARDYLHAYLIDQIVRHMQGDAERAQIDITDELLAWRSIGRPGCWGAGDPNYIGRDRIDEAAYAAGGKCLEDFLTADGNKIEALKLAAAVEVARDLAWRDTQVVCHQLWGTSIERVWSMSEAFLQLFRKAELARLALEHGLDAPAGDKKWHQLKLAEQRAEILTRKGMGTIGKPQILQALYADVEKPHVPYSQRGDDYYDDPEDEEACDHGVPFEEICEACEEEEGADE